MPYAFTLPIIRLAFVERPFFDLPLSYRYQDRAAYLRSPLNTVYAIASSLHPLSPLLLLALLLSISGPLSHIRFSHSSDLGAWCRRNSLNQSLAVVQGVAKHPTGALPCFGLGFGWQHGQFFELSLSYRYRGGLCVHSFRELYATLLETRCYTLPHFSRTLDLVAVEADRRPGSLSRIGSSVDLLFSTLPDGIGVGRMIRSHDRGSLPSCQLTKTAFERPLSKRLLPKIGFVLLTKAGYVLSTQLTGVCFVCASIPPIISWCSRHGRFCPSMPGDTSPEANIHMWLF